MSKSLENLMAEVEEKIGKKALIKLLKDVSKIHDEFKAKGKLDANLILAKAASEAFDSLLIKLPEHDDCNHGVSFDEEEYKKNPGMTSAEVRERWPRGWGPCPKGCGFDGIAYASYLHYIAGDW